MARDQRRRPPEVEPVFDRCVALGDRKQAGQARFRGQQIIVMGVEPVGCDVVADVEQSKVLVVQQAEIHREGQVLGPHSDLDERDTQSGGRLLALIKGVGQRGSPRQPRVVVCWRGCAASDWLMSSRA